MHANMLKNYQARLNAMLPGDNVFQGIWSTVLSILLMVFRRDGQYGGSFAFVNFHLRQANVRFIEVEG